MKILVIGATGYIGSTVAEKLKENGHTVFGLGRSESSIAKLNSMGIRPHKGNLKDPASIISLLPEIDALFHIGYVLDDKQTVNEGRSHLTNILKAMEGSNKHFIFTSGTGVLLDTEDKIYSEETPLKKTTLYTTIARRAVEQEALDSYKNGIHSIVLRPPVVYGRAGSYLIPKDLIIHALTHKESIYIEGTANNMWSTVDVDDLADLYLLCLEKAEPGSLWHTTDRSGVTTKSIAESVSRLAGLNGKTKSVSLAYAQEFFSHWAQFWTLNNQSSANKAKEKLGWKPRRASMLEDIENGSYKALLKTQFH